MSVLTKSKYLVGLECPKQLWITFNQPEKIKELSVGQQFIINQGINVGGLAKNLFKDGIDLKVEDYSDNIKKTQEALKQNKTLFEAGFQSGNCFSRADILEPIGNEWDIIEVKSGNSVKDINLHDLSFQKYVYESSGLKIRKCFLMHLNGKYVKNGEIDVKKLFLKDDVTSEVNKAMVGISERINEMFKLISMKEQPKAGVLTKKLFSDGHHDCLDNNCLDNNCLELDENHVFCLYRENKKYKEIVRLIIKFL